MKKIAISVLVLLAVLLVSCMDSMEASDVLAARAAEGDIKWDAKYLKDAVDIIPLKSDRSNASGKGVTKITSNAHSNDYPGVYFRWDEKQKDDGYLLVKESLFETLLGFTLTAKVSSTYWDFNIAIQDGQEANDDGYYVYYIPKGKWHYVINEKGEKELARDNGCNKNINMVFIGNEKLIKSAIPEITGKTEVNEEYVISFKKVVTDANFPDGVPVELWSKDADKFSFEVRKDGKTIESGLKLDANQTVTCNVPSDGVYEIVETINGTDKYEGSTITVEPIKATKTISLISKANKVGGVYEVSNNFKMEGVGILDVWKNGLAGFDKAFGNAKFIWDTEETYLYGVTGSAIIHYSTSFELSDAELAAIDSFPVNFAADNAAVMFVNGTRVGYTSSAISAENIEIIEKDGFTDFSNEAFLGSAWQVVYNVNIANALVAGKNEVVFYAANSDTNGGQFDITNNPCGLIFFGETVIETGTGEPGVYTNTKVVGADVIKMDGDEVKGVEKYDGKAKGGTTGINGQKVSTGTSWFTFANLADIEEGKWVTCQVVNGNNGNPKYDIVGQVFVQKLNGKLKVVVDGTGADYHLQMLDVAPIGDNGQKDAKHGTLNPFTVDYQPNLYLKVSANFYRF